MKIEVENTEVEGTISQVCIIEKVDNGFYVKFYDHDIKGYKKFVVEEIPTKCTFSEENKDEDVLKPMVAVFESMMAYFGCCNNNHSSKTLDVSIVDRDDSPVKYTLHELKKRIKHLMVKYELLESCDQLEDSQKNVEEGSKDEFS